MTSYLSKCLIVLVTVTLICHTSQSQNLQALKIGDRMPAMVFDSLIGFSKPAFKTADYNNRLVIFDFWSTWCHWCIEAFPKNDSLQSTFGNKIQFMPVDCASTDDSKQKIAAFYTKRKERFRNFSLPTIYSDTVLEQLFPHNLIPHYAWVNKGIVVAITDSDDVNAGNIKKVLNGEKVAFKLKEE